ncbi:MAG: ATP-binding cassette domain-containing protein [Alphaproteobacteria bacterium]|nr:ATP-binding cassette domain-containing protein [Alphaproteobacteria bacterium]
MAVLPRPLLAAAVAAGAIAWLATADAYGLRLLALGGVYALLVVGYQLVLGHAGALSLAQGALFGIGAYAAAMLTSEIAWLARAFPLTLAASAGAAMLAASIVAVPVLRLGAHSFALATLCLAQAAVLAALHGGALTGGANGIAGVPLPRLGAWTLPRGLALTLLAWACAGAGAWIAWRLTRRGRALVLATLRDAPDAAAALGIDAGRMRFVAFVAGAGLAGAAGALQAHVVGVASPESAGLGVMLACLAMTVVGGSRSLWGGMAAALLLVHLPEWLRAFDRWSIFAYGAALLIAVLFAPDGVAGLFARRRAAPEPLPAAPPPAVLPAPAPRAAAGAPALRARGLAKRFGGIAALDGVDLDLVAGRITGLIGPNGSGKTTLVNLLSGTVAADAGAVTIAGADGSLRALAGPPHRRARAGLGRSFQMPALPPGLSAADAVAAGWLAQRPADGSVPALAQARAQALALLRDAQALPWAGATCDALPAGARRLVDIARACAAGPRVLLLDEPAAGLAPDEATALGQLLRDRAAGGMALLVIEHSMGFLMPLADRVVCLDAGRVIAVGPPQAVAADPTVRAAYLGQRVGQRVAP